MGTEEWVPTTCSDGTEDTYPTDLCIDITNTSAYSNEFTYIRYKTADDMAFEEFVQATGDLYWTNDATTNNWPVVDGTYNWLVSCESTYPINDTINSSERVFYYDLTAPAITNIADDSSVSTPEIGGVLTVSADVSDAFGVDVCQLWINAFDGFENVSSVTVGSVSDSIDLDYTVTSINLKDAVFHPDYFREDTRVWTKVSMEDGDVITITFDNTDNLYDTYEENADAVFEFFEPFDNTTINTSIWDAISTESTTMTVTGGEGQFLDDDSDNPDYFETIEKFARPAILEWKQRDHTNEDWPLEVAFGHGTSNTIGKLKVLGTYDHYTFKSYKNGVPYQTGDYADTDSYEVFKIVWNENLSELYVDDVLLETIINDTYDDNAVPYVDSSVAFGNLIAGGSNGQDTEGYIEWMFVRKYSDNMPEVSCNDNVCTVNASNGSFTDLQIPLTTTYTTGDISLTYSTDNTEVDYKLTCADDSGNLAESAEYSITVKDVTPPTINLSGLNDFDMTNLSVWSNDIDELNLVVNYYDYNLFQASENITCDVSGNVWAWEDIDVEVFNYDVESKGYPIYNESYGWDTDDTTYASVWINKTDVNGTYPYNEGYVGQDFDGFYYVGTLEYKYVTDNSYSFIQTYDGLNWNNVVSTGRTTTTYTSTFDINDTIRGIRFFFNDTTDTASQHNKLYYMRYGYEGGIGNEGASYTHTEKINLKGLPLQRCEFFASASDDHTETDIPEYEVTYLDDGLQYGTEHEIEVTILTNEPDSLLTADTEKLDDRYTFEFNYDTKTLVREFTLKSDGHKIYSRDESNYPAHFVVWNNATKAGNWVDFSDIKQRDRDYTVEKIDDFEYNIKLVAKTPLDVCPGISTEYLTPENCESYYELLESYGMDDFDFNSIGGTNVANITITFYIGASINMSGFNQYDNGSFLNYTAALTTINAYPPSTYTETFNQTNATNVTERIDNLANGTYQLAYTHNQFFDQTYEVEIEQFYDDCYQESANESESCGANGSGNYSYDTGWVNPDKAIDGAWDYPPLATYASVDNTIGLKYYYFNYSKPEALNFTVWGPYASNAVHKADWVFNVGDSGDPDDDEKVNATLSDACIANTTVQLRIGFEWSSANNRTVQECYNGTAWEQVTYNGVPEFYTFDNKLWEEALIWYTTAPNIIDTPYSTYQVKVTYIVRNVKTQEVLNDYNVTVHNTNGSGQDNYQVADNTTTSLTYYLNATTYDVIVNKDTYELFNESKTYTYRQELTQYLDLAFNTIINLFDEKDLTGFDMNQPDKVEFIVFCPDHTKSTTLTNNVQTVGVDCAYEKFKFMLTYGDSGYYRTYITAPEDAFNQSIYLIDIGDTAYIYSSFIIDDLLGDFNNPRILISKLIEDDRVQITGDYTDIEGKIGAFLIENHEYIIEIHSDNQPILELGGYSADVGGDKTLRLYDITLAANDLGGFHQAVTTYLAISEDGTSVVGSYVDADNLTSINEFRIYENGWDETLIFSTPCADPSNCPVQWTISEAHNESTLVAGYSLSHADFSPLQISQYVQTNSGINLVAFDYLSDNFTNWFFLLFLATLAIMATIRSSNVVSLVMIALGGLFVAFGWWGMSGTVLAIAFVVALLYTLARGAKSE